MTLELFAAYIAASLLVLIIPGPTILLVIAQSLAHGRRVALASVIGVGLGDLLAISLALAGVGAVLAASASLFMLLKWLGAAWLIWLGIKMWLKPTAPHEMPNTAADSAGKVLRESFVVTALNPKSIAFFVAFLPHFIPEQAGLADHALLAGSFVLLAMVNAAMYALAAAHIGATLASPRAQAWLHRIGGSCLIGAGVFTASLQRN